jgi:hypothetical protein
MDTNKLIFNEIWHYSNDDPNFECDYYYIEVWHDNIKIVTFGDSYHDRGQDKLQNFYKGVVWATGKEVEVLKKNIADCNY